MPADRSFAMRTTAGSTSFGSFWVSRSCSNTMKSYASGESDSRDTRGTVAGRLTAATQRKTPEHGELRSRIGIGIIAYFRHSLPAYTVTVFFFPCLIPDK